MRQDVMEVNRPAGFVRVVGRGHQLGKLNIVSDHLASSAIPRDPLPFVEFFNLWRNITGLDIEVVGHDRFPLEVEWIGDSLIRNGWKSEGESDGYLI